jgi:dTDP-4-dehydrorhamnose 3,5-epimerase-like enzyme
MRDKVTEQLPAGVRILPLQAVSNDSGSLSVAETGVSVPFNIVRTFHITGMPLKGLRGRHAHRRCNQFMVCLNGAMSIRCDDGTGSRTARLVRPDRGLLVPPGIWIELQCEAEQSVLLVLCDRLYEEADYIRDWADFKTWRAAQ